MCHSEPVLSGEEVFVCMVKPDNASLCSCVFYGSLPLKLAPLVIVDVYRVSEGKQFTAEPSQDYKTFVIPPASLLQMKIFFPLFLLHIVWQVPEDVLLGGSGGCRGSEV